MRRFQITVGTDGNEAKRIFDHFSTHGWAVFSNGNKEIFLTIHGSLTGQVHGIARIAKMFEDKFGKPFKPNGIICCYPKLVKLRMQREGNELYKVVIGDWDIPTLINVVQDPKTKEFFPVIFYEPCTESVAWLVGKLKEDR